MSRFIALSSALSGLSARAAALCAAVLTATGMAQAQLLEPAQPGAHASFIAMSLDSLPDRQRARLSTAMPLDGAPGMAGASATFGWLEATGEVLLMSQGDYRPAAQLARTQRVLEDAPPIRGLAELPRYLMVCSWTRVDGEAQAPAVAYAERDDANGRQRSARGHASLSVPWVPSAGRRAQAGFAGHDWCGEIARSGRSTARLWPLPDKSPTAARND